MTKKERQRKRGKAKIARIYRKIIASVDCRFYVSKRGVPLLVTKDNYSFCYFLSKKCVKVFSNFGVIGSQRCWTFKDVHKAIKFYLERTGNYKELPIQNENHRT